MTVETCEGCEHLRPTRAFVDPKEFCVDPGWICQLLHMKVILGRVPVECPTRPRVPATMRNAYRARYWLQDEIRARRFAIGDPTIGYIYAPYIPIVSLKEMCDE